MTNPNNPSQNPGQQNNPRPGQPQQGAGLLGAEGGFPQRIRQVPEPILHRFAPSGVCTKGTVPGPRRGRAGMDESARELHLRRLLPGVIANTSYLWVGLRGGSEREAPVRGTFERSEQAG